MKKRSKFLIAAAVILLVVLIMQFEYKSYAKRVSKWTKVNSSSSFEIVVSEVYLNHNDLAFNDSLLIDVGQLENLGKDIKEVWNMKTPFNAVKKSGSDTIEIKKDLSLIHI